MSMSDETDNDQGGHFSSVSSSTSLRVQEHLKNVINKRFKISKKIIERCMTNESMKKEIDNFISSVIDSGEGKDIVKPIIFSISYDNDEERQYVACGFVPSNESVTALAVTAASSVTPVSSGDDIVHSLRFMEVDLSSPDSFLNTTIDTMLYVHESFAQQTQNKCLQINKIDEDINKSNLVQLKLIWRIVSSQIKEFDTLTSVTKGELYDPEEYLSQWVEKASTYVNEYLENPLMFLSRHAEQNIEIDDKGPGLELLLWNIEFFFLKKVIGIAQSRKVNDSYTSTFDENLKKKFLNTVHKIEESSMLASNKLKCLESVAMVWKTTVWFIHTTCIGMPKSYSKSIGRLSTVSNYYRRPEALGSLFQKVAMQLVDFSKDI